MSQMTLGVLALYLSNRQLEEISVFKKLVLLGKKLNLNVVIFTPEDVQFSKKTVHALHYDTINETWYRKWIPVPPIIYDRCRYQRNYRFQLLRKFRAAFSHLTYLNRPIALKWGVHQSLSHNETVRPFLPATIKYHQANDLTQFLQKHKLVFLKPIDGTGGRGIIRIQRLGEGLCLVQGRDRSRKIIEPQRIREDQIAEKFSDWDLKDRYLIQQGIQLTLKDGRVHDFRLLIQKNGSGEWEITGCAGRIGPNRSITSNLHGGGSAVPMMKLLKSQFQTDEKINDIRNQMHKLSHAVVRHLEKNFGRLCEMALDIAVDPKGKAWLLEVNPKPAREVFRRIKENETYQKAIQRPLEYASWLSRQSQ